MIREVFCQTPNGLVAKKFYNFRHDKDRTNLVTGRILKHHQLSQGWGGGSNEANLDLRQGNFVNECAGFHNLTTTSIATNLSRIRNFKDGDILINPHIPARGCLSIHEIKGDFPECYIYIPDDPTYLNHRINLHNSIGLEPDQQISIYNVNLAEYCAKLRNLRLPVLPIPEFEILFKNIINEFHNDHQQEYAASELDEYLYKLAEGTVDYLIEKLRKIAPAGEGISFENLCERLLVLQGYKIVNRHLYDRQGEDVDIHC